MKKYLIFSAAAIAIFFFPRSSFAYTQYFQQPNYGVTSTLVMGVTTTIPLGASAFSYGNGSGDAYGVVAYGFYVAGGIDNSHDVTVTLFNNTKGDAAGTFGIAKTSTGGNCRSVHDATTTDIWIGMMCAGNVVGVDPGDDLSLELYLGNNDGFLWGGHNSVQTAFVMANATGTANTDCNFPNTGAGCSTSWKPMADYLRNIVTPPITDPTVGFVYPVSSLHTPDFANWIVNVSTTASSTFGTIRVRYGQTSSSLQFSDAQQFSQFVSVDPAPITKSILLNPIAQLVGSSTWYAQAEYSGDGFDTTSSIISFVVDPNATSTQSTTTVQAGTFTQLPLNNPSSTGSNPLPYSDCDLSHLGGCLTNAGVFLGAFFFRPSTGPQQVFNNGLSALKLSFPFSLVFGINDIVASSTNQFGSTDRPIVLPVPAQLVAYVGSVGITLLSSSTINHIGGDGSNGIALKTLVFAIEDAILFVGTIVIIYLTVAGKKK